MELTQEIVQELFSYDPDTGNTFWRPRDEKWFIEKGSRFSRTVITKRWNTRYAEKKSV